ncbi:hypothetical protein Q5581_24565, partial [Escherichia coli]|nr:hypothetical protein [Escherichia coli]
MATRQRDKMYFWSTAGTPMTPGQVPPDTVCLLSFCYLFATFLLSDCYHSLFALHKQGTLAMYTSPRR